MPNVPTRGKIIPLNRKRPPRRATSPTPAVQAPPARVIAVTSGKGGVGKTNIVANLGYALRKAGQRVLIFDADLGLGNMDVLLGLTPRYNLSHVIDGEKRLDEIVVDGPGNLKILPASSGIQALTRLTPSQKSRIAVQMHQVLSRFDMVLVDTAAGISADVLYFNASASEIMVVVTPEPTAITDAYALIKVLSVKYREKNFRLLVNLAKHVREADDVSRQLCLVAKRFLDVSIDYFGCVLIDENVKAGVRRQQLVGEMAPMTQASRDFAELGHKLVRSEPMASCPGQRQPLWQDIV